MRKFATLSIMTLLLHSAPSYAEWFQASGSSFIDSSGKKIAKTRATENALKKALLVAGASVSSVQQVVNGLMTKNELNVRASGVVNGFEIVEETTPDSGDCAGDGCADPVDRLDWLRHARRNQLFPLPKSGDG